MILVGLYAILSLRLKDPEIAGGYVPRLHIHDNICLGQAIVADEEGKACIINAEIAIPTPDFLEIESYLSGPPFHFQPYIIVASPAYAASSKNHKRSLHLKTWYG